MSIEQIEARQEQNLTFAELEALYARDDPDVWLVNVTDLGRIADRLQSRSSATWGAGRNAGPGWIELAVFSPPRPGSKQVIEVCAEHGFLIKNNWR